MVSSESGETIEAIDPFDVDRPRGLLSEADRRFLLSTEAERREQWSSPAYYKRKNAIPERLRHALADFVFLMRCYPLEQRDELFDVTWRTQEEFDLRRDLRAMIAFVYSGCRGDPMFKRALIDGVRDAELDLGNVESRLEVNVNYHGVDRATPAGVTETTERIENGEWNDVDPVDLQAWIRTMQTGSESFDATAFLEEARERAEYVDEQNADDSDLDRDDTDGDGDGDGDDREE